MKTYTVVRVGAEYGGACVKCGMEERDEEDLKRVLLVKGPGGKFGILHPFCAGGKVVIQPGRGRVFEGPATIDVPG